MATALATCDDRFMEVKAVLESINMPPEVSEAAGPFDFSREFEAGTHANVAAAKANIFWWRAQNQGINQDCLRSAG